MIASVEPTLKDVRLEFTPPAGAVAAHIWRVGPSDIPADVRDWSNHAVTAGEVTVARDYEAPIGVELVYTAQFKNDSGGTGVAAAGHHHRGLAAGCADTWLNDLARAQNTMRIVVEQLPELAYVVPATVHEIITRRAPIVSSDVAHTPDVRAVVSDRHRRPARARAGHARQRGAGAAALGPGGGHRQRLHGGARSSPSSAWSRRAPCLTGASWCRPARSTGRTRRCTRPAPPTTFAEVDATFATLQELKDGRATWDAVLYALGGRGGGRRGAVAAGRRMRPASTTVLRVAALVARRRRFVRPDLSRQPDPGSGGGAGRHDPHRPHRRVAAAPARYRSRGRSAWRASSRSTSAPCRSAATPSCAAACATPTGQTEQIQLGRLRVESVSWDSLETTASLELADRMAQVRDEPFSRPVLGQGQDGRPRPRSGSSRGCSAPRSPTAPRSTRPG